MINQQLHFLSVLQRHLKINDVSIAYSEDKMCNIDIITDFITNGNLDKYQGYPDDILGIDFVYSRINKISLMSFGVKLYKKFIIHILYEEYTMISKVRGYSDCFAELK